MARIAKNSIGDVNGKNKTRPKTVSARRKPNKLDIQKAKQPKEKQNPGPTFPHVSLRNSIVRWSLILLVLVAITVAVYFKYPIEHKIFFNNLSSLSFFKTEDSRVTSISERVALLETEIAVLETKDTVISRLKQRVEEVSGKFANISTRLGLIEKSLSGVNKSVVRMTQSDLTGEIKVALDSVRQRLKELEQNKVDPKIGDQAFEVFKRRLHRIEKNISLQIASRDIEVDKKSAIFLAFNQLRYLVRLGDSYERELRIFEELVGDTSSFKKAMLSLNDHANTGVPTMETLRRELKDIAGTMVAESREESAKNWYSKLVAKLGMVVTIRRTDGGEMGSVEELVASAESKMETRNLGKAINLVKSVGAVSNRAGAVAVIWLGRASSRLAVDNALVILSSHAVSFLGRAIRE